MLCYYSRAYIKIMVIHIYIICCAGILYGHSGDASITIFDPCHYIITCYTDPLYRLHGINIMVTNSHSFLWISRFTLTSSHFVKHSTSFIPIMWYMLLHDCLYYLHTCMYTFSFCYLYSGFYHGYKLLTCKLHLSVLSVVTIQFTQRRLACNIKWYLKHICFAPYIFNTKAYNIHNKSCKCNITLCWCCW